MTVRHIVVHRLAAPGLAAVRDVYTSHPGDVLRVAALVEISAAAAALARTVVRLRHLDPATITAYVSDPTDASAVLGRGRWLPTMTRHVPRPPGAFPASVRHRVARRAGSPDQTVLPLGEVVG